MSISLWRCLCWSVNTLRTWTSVITSLRWPGGNRPRLGLVSFDQLHTGARFEVEHTRQRPSRATVSERKLQADEVRTAYCPKTTLFDSSNDVEIVPIEASAARRGASALGPQVATR
jgi:hypothetical protein